MNQEGEIQSSGYPRLFPTILTRLDLFWPLFVGWIRSLEALKFPIVSLWLEAGAHENKDMCNLFIERRKCGRGATKSEDMVMIIIFLKRYYCISTGACVPVEMQAWSVLEFGYQLLSSGFRTLLCVEASSVDVNFVCEPCRADGPEILCLCVHWFPYSCNLSSIPSPSKAAVHQLRDVAIWWWAVRLCCDLYWYHCHHCDAKENKWIQHSYLYFSKQTQHS